MAKVVLDSVYKTYKGEKGREVTAVENLNLTIYNHEFLVLVGPSGCGKSTTLRMIAGLEEISKGQILIDDRRINDVPPKDRDIAMVFQNYALYPHMSVYKNMAFGLELRKYPKAEIEQRVREASEILGLSPEILERKPKALSGGQRQRVAVGRAIVRKPKAFLFDEPLSNLDAKMRVQMRTEISKLHQRLGTTMIYVTHDQVEAMTMGDRIVVMSNGHIQQAAEPLEIYHHPANVFVAGFIGSPPMNFIEGKIVQRSGYLAFQEITEDGGNGPIVVTVTDEQAHVLNSHLNEKVIMGIRPEDLEDGQLSSNHDPQRMFKATLEVIEPMGAETYLYFSTGSHLFILRTQSNVLPEVNSHLEIVMNMDKAHFFHWKDKADFHTSSGEVEMESWQAACNRIV